MKRKRMGGRNPYGARGRSTNESDKGIDASRADRTPEPIIITGEPTGQAPQKTNSNTSSGFYVNPVNDWREQ